MSKRAKRIGLGAENGNAFQVREQAGQVGRVAQLSNKAHALLPESSAGLTRRR